jgi:hypothetical protein
VPPQAYEHYRVLKNPEISYADRRSKDSWGEPRGWHGGFPDTIGPYNIDPWVYRYSSENVPPQAYEHYRIHRNPEMSFADTRR